MIDREVFPGYLFDLDGVLIDSMQYHEEAFRVVLDGYDLELGNIDIGGRSTREILEEVQRKNPKVTLPITDLTSLKRSVAQVLLTAPRRDILNPNANEVLGFLTSVARVGICTSGSRSSLELFLSLVSSTLEFDVLLSADDVLHSKPSPEIFLKGVSMLGIEARNVLVVEDSKSGIESGLSAGCQVAQLVTSANKAPEESGAHYTIGSLKDLLPHTRPLVR